jgi:hypothetical protein
MLPAIKIQKPHEYLCIYNVLFAFIAVLLPAYLNPPQLRHETQNAPLTYERAQQCRSRIDRLTLLVGGAKLSALEHL